MTRRRLALNQNTGKRTVEHEPVRIDERDVLRLAPQPDDGCEGWWRDQLSTEARARLEGTRERP